MGNCQHPNKKSVIKLRRKVNSQTNCASITPLKYINESKNNQNTASQQTEKLKRHHRRSLYQFDTNIIPSNQGSRRRKTMKMKTRALSKKVISGISPKSHNFIVDSKVGRIKKKLKNIEFNKPAARSRTKSSLVLNHSPRIKIFSKGKVVSNVNHLTVKMASKTKFNSNSSASSNNTQTIFDSQSQSITNFKLIEQRRIRKKSCINQLQKSENQEKTSDISINEEQVVKPQKDSENDNQDEEFLNKFNAPLNKNKRKKISQSKVHFSESKNPKILTRNRSKSYDDLNEIFEVSSEGTIIDNNDKNEQMSMIESPIIKNKRFFSKIKNDRSIVFNSENKQKALDNDKAKIPIDLPLESEYSSTSSSSDSMSEKSEVILMSTRSRFSIKKNDILFSKSNFGATNTPKCTYTQELKRKKRTLNIEKNQMNQSNNYGMDKICKAQIMVNSPSSFLVGSPHQNQKRDSIKSKNHNYIIKVDKSPCGKVRQMGMSQFELRCSPNSVGRNSNRSVKSRGSLINFQKPFSKYLAPKLTKFAQYSQNGSQYAQEQSSSDTTSSEDSSSDESY